MQTTDATAAVTMTRQYDSFGRPLSSQTTSGYAYTSRELDGETGLYCYRARYYDPSLGRFISEDPVGFTAGANFYSYVLNNPATYVDPFGLDVAVIYGGPAGKNILWHIGIAVTGQGVFSSGTAEPMESNVIDYLRIQTEHRDMIIYIMRTTNEQAEAVVQAFLGYFPVKK